MNELRSKDFQFFIDNYNWFFEKYGHKFIVIKNQKVLGAYDDVDTALNITMKSEELGTFIVQECTGDVSAYTCTISTLCVV